MSATLILNCLLREWGIGIREEDVAISAGRATSSSMRSPTKRRRYDGHVDEPVEDAEEVSPSESAPDDQSASDGETRGTHAADLSPLLTRAMTVDMDLIPLVDVDLPDPQARLRSPRSTDSAAQPPRGASDTTNTPRLIRIRVARAQPADTAALESLSRIQMPLDGAPLDESRLDIGEVMSLSEVSSRSEGLEILRMSSGVKVSTLPYHTVPYRAVSLTALLDPSPRPNLTLTPTAVLFSHDVIGRRSYPPYLPRTSPRRSCFGTWPWTRSRRRPAATPAWARWCSPRHLSPGPQP